MTGTRNTRGLLYSTLVGVSLLATSFASGMYFAQDQQETNYWGKDTMEKQESSDLEMSLRYEMEDMGMEAGEHTDRQVARRLTTEGNRVYLNEEYEKALPLLEVALGYWNNVPDEQLRSDYPGEYANTLGFLGECYVRSTLDAYFEEEKPFRGSIPRLKRGKELLQRAQEHYSLAREEAETQQEADSIGLFMASFYNVEGLAHEYLGEMEEAEKDYKRAIEMAGLEKPKSNLATLGEKSDVFVK